MIKLKVNELLIDDKIKTASGLLNHNNKIYLVADDVFGIFSWDSVNKWILNKWLEAPSVKSDYLEQKKIKLDLESVMLSPWDKNQIIAVPSGSTLERDRALVLDINTQAITSIDSFKPIYKNLRNIETELNIEACFQFNDFLIFLNRGVGLKPSTVFRFSLTPLTYIDKTQVSFPSRDSLPGQITEACLFNNKLYVLFAIENTLDTYNDGKILGSGIAELDIINFQISRFEFFDLLIKAEGLTRFNNQWLICTDPDGIGNSQFFTFDF